MRALVQRVKAGSVEIDGQQTAAINDGLVVLLGVGRQDDLAAAEYLAKKTANLRIFEDAAGKMNRSLLDICGAALVVSQFTLYADSQRGNRPGFDQAAPPEQAEELYQAYVAALRAAGVAVQTGTFRAEMLVRIDNHGPVTILLESPPSK